MKKSLLLLVNLIALLLIGLSVNKPQAGIGSRQNEVVEVVDGDTIIVNVNGSAETVRLIGVDTPETKDPRKPLQCYGAEASAYTKTLALGKTVQLVADSKGTNRDKYKRLLRYAYLPDGTLLNQQIITGGFGFAYIVFPYEKLDQFKDAEASARTGGLGLWSACKVDESTKIKQTGF